MFRYILVEFMNDLAICSISISSLWTCNKVISLRRFCVIVGLENIFNHRSIYVSINFKLFVYYKG
jgi:hypothetical protein